MLDLESGSAEIKPIKPDTGNAVGGKTEMKMIHKLRPYLAASVLTAILILFSQLQESAGASSPKVPTVGASGSPVPAAKAKP